jgi:hypothetical protein
MSAGLLSESLVLDFELGRVPGYRHPYGPVEQRGKRAWAQIDLASASWKSLDDTTLGAFESGPNHQSAPIRDDLELLGPLLHAAQPLEIIHAEPIVLWVDRSKPTVSQLQENTKIVLRAAAAAGKNVVLPYNNYGCIALMLTDKNGSARVTLINPPWREYEVAPVRAATYPLRVIGAGVFMLGCMFGGCR